PRLRVAGGTASADRLRRADTRHADPAAAVRAVLRHRGGDPPAGVRSGTARAGVELCRLRERDLPIGARSDLGRTTGGGADARIERAAGAHARARAAGFPPGAGAD